MIKRAFKLIVVVGLVAAFAALGAAMVLPHAHDADTVQHACWVCQSKSVHVSSPEAVLQPAPVSVIVVGAPAEPASGQSQTVFLVSEARAPPVLSFK